MHFSCSVGQSWERAGRVSVSFFFFCGLVKAALQVFSAPTCCYGSQQWLTVVFSDDDGTWGKQVCCPLISILIGCTQGLFRSRACCVLLRIFCVYILRDPFAARNRKSCVPASQVWELKWALRINKVQSCLSTLEWTKPELCLIQPL